MNKKITFDSISTSEINGKNAEVRNLSGALFTDLSKSFECLPHNSSAAKLSAQSQCDRFWQKISTGVPQGSIRELVLFNIDLCSLFLS